MFGRHPRLAIDAFLGLPTDQSIEGAQTEYVVKLRDRLTNAYKKARLQTEQTSAVNKRRYDEKTKNVMLHINDRVLVRNVTLRGKQKLADKWEEHPYVVVAQPDSSVPVFQVKREGARFKKVRTLHRNLLLPFMSVTDNTEDQTEDRNAVEEKEFQTDDPNGNTADEVYVIPMRRPPGSPALSPPKERQKRQVKKPDRYFPDDFRKK